jgi:hypothetical protein
MGFISKQLLPDGKGWRKPFDSSGQKFFIFPAFFLNNAHPMQSNVLVKAAIRATAVQFPLF